MLVVIEMTNIFTHTNFAQIVIIELYDKGIKIIILKAF